MNGIVRYAATITVGAAVGLLVFGIIGYVVVSFGGDAIVRNIV